MVFFEHEAFHLVEHEGVVLLHGQLRLEALHEFMLGAELALPAARGALRLSWGLAVERGTLAAPEEGPPLRNLQREAEQRTPDLQDPGRGRQHVDLAVAEQQTPELRAQVAQIQMPLLRHEQRVLSAD